MTKALAALRTRLSEEEGATVVEYGLMIGLVAIVLVGAAILLRDPLIDLFSSTRPTGLRPAKAGESGSLSGGAVSLSGGSRCLRPSPSALRS